MSKTNYASFSGRNELDVSDLRERGEELKQAIFNAVKDTQGIIMSPLPNVLIMTAEQYMDQDPNPEMMPAYKSKDRLFITPLNAMDVVVKDPENFPPEDEE